MYIPMQKIKIRTKTKTIAMMMMRYSIVQKNVKKCTFPLTFLCLKPLWLFLNVRKYFYRPLSILGWLAIENWLLTDAFFLLIIEKILFRISFVSSTVAACFRWQFFLLWNMKQWSVERKHWKHYWLRRQSNVRQQRLYF